MKEYHAYLFDADGTLIDTAELIYQSYVHTTTFFHAPVPTRDSVVASIGMPLRNQIESFFGPLSDERYDTIQKEYMRYQMGHFKEHLTLFPGVFELLHSLKDLGKPLAIVTSRRKASLEPFLKHLEIWDLFEVIVTPECTTLHKPSPEPLYYTLTHLGLSTEQVLFIGDSSFDIEAGVAADIDTVFVTWSFFSPSDLPVTPTYLINQPGELLWQE